LDPRAGEPVTVIRQRDRSDHDYPDIGHYLEPLVYAKLWPAQVR
jgi:hypothetical protein